MENKLFAIRKQNTDGIFFGRGYMLSHGYCVYLYRV